MVIAQPIEANIGPSLWKQARIVLSNDIILTLPTTADPITCIPAPGPGFVIFSPTYQAQGGCIIYMDSYAADYSDIGDPCEFQFTLGDNGPYARYAGFEDFFAWGIPGAFAAPAYHERGGGGGFVNTVTDFEDKPLTLRINNLVAATPTNFSGGDPANNIVVTFLYQIYNIETGLFVL